MTLGEYLKSAGERRWKWSEHDCCTFAADWAIQCGHVDPMIRWRGSYSTADEAQALIEEAEGLANLWALAFSGYPEPDEPRAGDVGVCCVMGEDGLTANGGIFTGERWAFLAPRGVHFTPIESRHVVKVWRL